MEDAANSLRLALEREEAGHAHQEAAALRRSRELQRGFLSRLSHELRTPLTAIRGYASSLMQPDVTWDRDSQQRFLDRIAAESARLGRLVDDLLDFSAIESGIMRLQRDWCDIRLVLEAAIACLPPGSAESVSLTCDAQPARGVGRPRPDGAGLREPAEQRVRPQPAGDPGPGHRRGRTGRPRWSISVRDDGRGMPPELAAAPFEPARRPRSATTSNGDHANGRPPEQRPATRQQRGQPTGRATGAQRTGQQPQERRRRAGPVHREGHRAGSRRPDRADRAAPRAPASACTCRSRPRSSTAAGRPGPGR